MWEGAVVGRGAQTGRGCRASTQAGLLTASHYRGPAVHALWVPSCYFILEHQARSGTTPQGMAVGTGHYGS